MGAREGLAASVAGLFSWGRRRLVAAAVIASTGVAALACQPPQAVVAEAIDAARAGDRDRYAACFTERSRPILWSYWDAADRHNPALGALGARGDIALSLERIVEPRRSGDVRATVLVEEAGERARLVLHQRAGTWRIDLIDTERELVGVVGFD